VVPVYLVWVTPEVFTSRSSSRKLRVALQGGGQRRRWQPREVEQVHCESRRSDYRRLHCWRGDVLEADLRRADSSAAPVGLAGTSLPRHTLVTRWPSFLVGQAACSASTLRITGSSITRAGDRKPSTVGAGSPSRTRTRRSPSARSCMRPTPCRSKSSRSRDVPAGRLCPRNIVYFVLAGTPDSSRTSFPGWSPRSCSALARPTAGALAVAGPATILLGVGRPAADGALSPTRRAGGPVGNRYFIAFYPLFLLPDSLADVRGGRAGGRRGRPACHGAVDRQPFLTLRSIRRNIHAHAVSTVSRRTPRLLEDLPVSVTGSGSGSLLGGTTAARLLLDYNAFQPSEGAFWVRGESETQLVLRVPLRQQNDGSYRPLRLRLLHVELKTGDLANGRRWFGVGSSKARGEGGCALDSWW